MVNFISPTSNVKRSFQFEFYSWYPNCFQGRSSIALTFSLAVVNIHEVMVLLWKGRVSLAGSWPSNDFSATVYNHWPSVALAFHRWCALNFYISQSTFWLFLIVVCAFSLLVCFIYCLLHLLWFTFLRGCRRHLQITLYVKRVDVNVIRNVPNLCNVPSFSDNITFVYCYSIVKRGINYQTLRINSSKCSWKFDI